MLRIQIQSINSIRDSALIGDLFRQLSQNQNKLLFYIWMGVSDDTPSGQSFARSLS